MTEMWPIVLVGVLFGGALVVSVLRLIYWAIIARCLRAQRKASTR